MYEGYWKINSKDLFATYGVVILKDSYSELLKMPDMKEYVSNDWAEENLKEIDFSLPRVKERDIALNFALIAKSEADWWGKYDAFCELLKQGGVLSLFVKELEQTFSLYYKSNTSFQALTRIKNTNKIGAKFSLKFADTKPQEVEDYVKIDIKLEWIDSRKWIDDNTLVWIEGSASPYWSVNTELVGYYIPSKGLKKGTRAAVVATIREITEFRPDVSFLGWYIGNPQTVYENVMPLTENNRCDFEVKPLQLILRVAKTNYPLPAGNLYPNPNFRLDLFSSQKGIEAQNEQIMIPGYYNYATARLSSEATQQIMSKGSFFINFYGRKINLSEDVNGTIYIDYFDNEGKRFGHQSVFMNAYILKERFMYMSYTVECLQLSGVSYIEVQFIKTGDSKLFLYRPYIGFNKL